MSEHRFYAGSALNDKAADAMAVLNGASAHRIARVLRLHRGDRLVVVGAGKEFTAELEHVGEEVRIRLLEERPAFGPTLPRLILYQALIRPQRFEWLIEKGTELGVSMFVPVLSELTAVRAAEIGPARLERWRRIAIEAMEQSGGLSPPEIRAPCGFREALTQARGCRLIAWEQVREAPSPAELRGLRSSAPFISLFVGPEGGFSAAEIAAAQAAGVKPLGLGPRLLRSETAALAAAALLQLG